MSFYAIKQANELGTETTELIIVLNDGRLEFTLVKDKPYNTAKYVCIVLTYTDARILRDIIDDLIDMEALDNG
jgi:hypothetical protein